MSALLRACHPAPTAAVTVIAVTLGVGMSLRPWELVLVGVTVLVGQLSIGWSNDWLDAPVDAKVGRRDKPAARGDVTPGTLRTAALTALVLAVPLSLLAGAAAGCAHLVLVASGWTYNVWLKRTICSPLPYALGFGSLPVYVALVGGVDVSSWLPVAGGLLGLAAHFANAAPDVEGDLRTGVRGMPQRVGPTASLVTSLALLAAVGLLAASQREADMWVWAVIVVAPPVLGVWLLVRGAWRSVFMVVMAAALLDVAALIFAA